MRRQVTCDVCHGGRGRNQSRFANLAHPERVMKNKAHSVKAKIQAGVETEPARPVCLVKGEQAFNGGHLGDLYVVAQVETGDKFGSERWPYHLLQNKSHNFVPSSW